MFTTLREWATGQVPWGVKRSPKWPAVRKAFLLEAMTCASCGKMRKLEVHHVVPFHIDPTRELDPMNLIALCRHCHFFVGHFLNWKHFNIDVRQHASDWCVRMTGGSL